MDTHSEIQILHVTAIEVTAQLLLRPQLLELQKAGFGVRVACCPTGEHFDRSLNSFDPIEIEFPRHLRPIKVVRACFRLVKLLRSMKPDVVHIHTPSVALTSRWIPRRFIPSETRVVYTVHGFAHMWNTGRSRDFILESAERVLAARTDLMLFVSAEDAQMAAQRGYKSTLRYLGNGVGDEWFSIAPPVREPGRLRILFVGRLVREKGILDLLDAVEGLPQIDLAIAGANVAGDRGSVSGEVGRLVSGPNFTNRFTS
jgi:glycosyltransferase involved in cell wall biosynthesis